jgi:hypothetical protein
MCKQGGQLGVKRGAYKVVTHGEARRSRGYSIARADLDALIDQRLEAGR